MIKAILFDMDGVLSDTQSLHAQVESEILGRYGIDLTPEEITRRYAGVRTIEFFKDLLSVSNPSVDVDALMVEKWQKVFEAAKKEILSIPGAVELIDLATSNNLKMAVVTASPREYADIVLSSLKIKNRFEIIVTGDQLKKGKPDPEGYLKAVSGLSLRPDECVVIEDGRSGMQAAKNGGMYCIGLVSNKSDGYPANILVTNLSEITMDMLRNLK